MRCSTQWVVEIDDCELANVNRAPTSPPNTGSISTQIVTLARLAWAIECAERSRQEHIARQLANARLQAGRDPSVCPHPIHLPCRCSALALPPRVEPVTPQTGALFEPSSDLTDQGVVGQVDARQLEALLDEFAPVDGDYSEPDE